MIILIKHGADKGEIAKLEEYLVSENLKLHKSEGESHYLIGLVGDTSRIEIDRLRSNSVVADVKRIAEPYKSANRKFHPSDTVISVGNAKIGGGEVCIIAGPCSVESKEQMIEVATRVKESGAAILRGGAFKPRTSPYAFQGLREKGIELLLEAKAATGLPVVTEILEIGHLPLFEKIDMIQVGARNMQNFELLKELGKTGKPILLKRGNSSTIEELLMSAEYIMAGGNEKVVLCERGIRTFETETRNTLDLSAVPVLKEHTHLPVIVDPSHATGRAALVPPMSLAAIASGADGLIIEVHNDPAHALCDGAQSLSPAKFDSLAKQIVKAKDFAYRYDL